jgi:hypothetical protein
MEYVFVYRSLIHYFITRGAIEMSQKLLEFIDDYDASVRKFKQEKKDKVCEVQARPPMPDGQAKGMLIQELIYCFVFFR